MGSGRSWRFDRPSLSRSLERWNATHPDDAARQLLNEWLMDLLLDPLRRGQEDLDQPGIFYGRVGGTNVGVIFSLDTNDLVVFVTLIA